MNSHRFLFFAVLYLIVGYLAPVKAQDILEYPGTEEGIDFKAADSSMQIDFSARMQNRFEYFHYNEDAEADRGQFLIRRMRLKADGYLVDPRLTFKLELAFSARDVSGNPEGRANVLLDAFVNYDLTPNLRLRFGQFKLPSNRQRVVSSRDLQMVDRTIVNSNYTLDRDVGLMLQYKMQLGQVQIISLSALTNGEGRNVVNSLGDINRNAGPDLALTQRLEVLPFGKFKDKGDYFEGDLLFEPTPKLSVGGGYSNNENAIRQRGQRGSLLFEPRDIETVFSDFIFKYRGWSLMGEYMKAYSKNPVTEREGVFRAVETGEGYTVQAGKVLPSYWEISGRYSKILPDEEVENFHGKGTEILFGLSRYIRGHRIKVQSDLGYITDESLPQNLQEYWQWRVQVEVGF